MNYFIWTLTIPMGQKDRSIWLKIVTTMRASEFYVIECDCWVEPNYQSGQSTEINMNFDLLRAIRIRMAIRLKDLIVDRLRSTSIPKGPIQSKFTRKRTQSRDGVIYFCKWKEKNTILILAQRSRSARSMPWREPKYYLHCLISRWIKISW